MHRREVIRALVVGAAAAAVGTPATWAILRATSRDGADGAPDGQPTQPATSHRDRSAPTEPAPPRHAREPDRGARQASAAAQVTLLCRSAWDARPPAGHLPDHTVQRLTVHHTAVAVGHRWSTERLRSHQSHHLAAGFSDIAYHVLVAPDGRAFEGRAMDQPGESFTDYDPAGHLHVCLDGDFTREEPTRAALDTLARVLAWGSFTYDVDPATIEGHRRYAATACPGGGVDARLPQLRSAVSELLDRGGVRLERTC